MMMMLTMETMALLVLSEQVAEEVIAKASSRCLSLCLCSSHSRLTMVSE